MNWEQIYTEYRPLLIEVAARRICERPDLEPGDLVHDVFAVAIGDPPPEEPDWGNFLTDLTAALTLGDAEPVDDLDLDVDDVDGFVDRSPMEDAALVAIRRVSACEMRKRMLRVMDYMTERQREITRMRLFEGLTVGEIAEVMNTSSSNVSQIVVRCLAKLAPILVQFDTFDQHDLERVRPPRRVR